MGGYVSVMGDWGSAGSMSSADLINSAGAELFYRAGAGVNVVFHWAFHLDKQSSDQARMNEMSTSVTNPGGSWHGCQILAHSVCVQIASHVF